MPLDAGELDRRIELQRDMGAAENEFNEIVADWQRLARPWAKVMFGRGEERRQAAQDNASIAAIFRVRRTASTESATAGDRILFDGGVWDIISNVPFERDGRDIAAVRSA